MDDPAADPFIPDFASKSSMPQAMPRPPRGGKWDILGRDGTFFLAHAGTPKALPWVFIVPHMFGKGVARQRNAI
jgi:hypothetical protein